MYVLLLIATLVTYAVASSILANFLARIFGYKQGGVFSTISILILILTAVVSIVITESMNTCFGILFASGLFILFVMGMDNEHKSID